MPPESPNLPQNEERPAHKCLCDTPDCAKCLGSTCKDIKCKFHPISGKIRWRERILSNYDSKPPIDIEKIHQVKKELLELKKFWSEKYGNLAK